MSSNERRESVGAQDRPQAEQPEQHGFFHDVSSAFKETYNMMVGNYPDRDGHHRFDHDEQMEQREDQPRKEDMRTGMEDVRRRRDDDLKKNREQQNLNREEDHEMAPESMAPNMDQQVAAPSIMHVPLFKPANEYNYIY